jgi:hypothetical protein
VKLSHIPPYLAPVLAALAALPAHAVLHLAPATPTHFTAAPGDPLRAAVTVTDGEGAPQPGVTIFFARPGPTALVERVSTNDDGLAEFNFPAPDDPGPFVVEALEAESASSIVFAVNVLTAAPPPVSPQAVLDRIDSDAIQGPYLLPAGAQIRTGPGAPLRTLGEPTWLAWRDSEPSRVFQHWVRIHLAGATGPERPIEILDDAWWPSVRLSPESPWISLRGWRESTVDGDYLESAIPAPQPDEESELDRLRRAAPAPRRIPTREPDACAVIVFGTDEGWQRTDEIRMTRFFQNQKALKPGNIITNTNEHGAPAPVTPKRLEELMTLALEKNCSRLYLVVIGHGDSGTVTLTRDGPLTGKEDQDKHIYSFETLAAQAKRFTNRNIPVTAFLKSCQSGSAIPIFHNAGVAGEIYTSSDQTEGSYYNWFLGSIFVRRLLDGYAADSADTNGNGVVSASEAFEYALNDSDNAAARPQAAILDPTSSLAISNVWIDLGGPAANPGVFIVTRPHNTAGEWEATIVLDDAGIAAFDPNPVTVTVKVPADQTQVRIPVKGLKRGETIARARIVDSQRKLWRGQAKVTVGGYQVSSSGEIGLKPGETAEVALQRAPRFTGAETLQIVPEDEESLATAQVDVQPFPASSNRTAVKIVGLSPGEALYHLRGREGDGARLNILIDGYRVKDPYLQTGTEAKFTLTRHGRLMMTEGDETVVIDGDPNFPVLALDQEVLIRRAERNASARFRCPLTPGVANLRIRDSKGNGNQAKLHCHQPPTDARSFAASPPFAFLQAGDLMTADMGFRDANGALIRFLPVELTVPTGIAALGTDPETEAPDRYWELMLRGASPPPPSSPQGRAAAIITPGTTRTIHTNASGFLRLFLAAPAAGTYNLGIRLGTVATTLPLRTVARLAPPPDDLVLLPLTPPFRVNQEYAVTTQVTRNQTGLQDAIVTLQSRNNNIRFLDGSVNTLGTTTQQRTNSIGRSTIRFRVLNPGPIDIGVFSGFLLREIKATAVP